MLLASTSPRRKTLLESLGIPFQVAANPWDEVPLPGESARAQVRRLSREKLIHFLQTHPENALPVLTADTLIDFRGRALGKPESAEQAWQWYRELAGSPHRVLTGVCLWIPPQEGRASKTIAKTVSTRIVFHLWNEPLYRRYLDSGEWRDAAGGYRIQETGIQLVDSVRGSWSNVVGLPLAEVYGMIRRYLSIS